MNILLRKKAKNQTQHPVKNKKKAKNPPKKKGRKVVTKVKRIRMMKMVMPMTI